VQRLLTTAILAGQAVEQVFGFFLGLFGETWQIVAAAPSLHPAASLILTLSCQPKVEQKVQA